MIVYLLASNLGPIVQKPTLESKRSLTDKLDAVKSRTGMSSIEKEEDDDDDEANFKELSRRSGVDAVSSEPKRKDKFTHLNKTRGYRGEVRVECFFKIPDN